MEIDRLYITFGFVVACLGAHVHQVEDLQFRIERNVSSRSSIASTTTVNDENNESRKLRVVQGDYEFVFTTLFGWKNPRISVECESDELIRVEYEKGVDGFGRAIKELGLEAVVEERTRPGWLLKVSELPNEDISNWPDDLFIGRKLKTRFGESVYSYAVREFEGGGAIYSKDGTFYFRDVSLNQLAKHLERTTRRVVIAEDHEDGSITCSFSRKALRNLGRMKPNRLIDSISLEFSDCSFQCTVVRERSSRN